MMPTGCNRGNAIVLRGLVAAAALNVLIGSAWGRPDDEGCGHAAMGWDDAVRQIKAYDPETGRSLLTYPPHPMVDFGHMKLVIDIPDMNTPRLAAVQTLTVSAIGQPVSLLTLDAHLLDIQSVQAAGHKTVFTADGKSLAITFDPPLAPGVKTDIVTAYSVQDPPQGLIWTPESPAWPGRPAQLHTQGQPGTNSFWFPCHDFPNVKLTTELAVTVPAGYLVSSNGGLVDAVSRSGEGGGARETFHWMQDKPHVNYLVSLVVGKFDVVDVGGGGGRSLSMPVYVPPGRGKDVAGTYGRTPRMIEYFAGLVDEPYPWDRYAQLVVWNFGAGGMENTGATTMYDTAILSPEGQRDGDLDGLISHELAHQWFGDLLTCRSWEHIWLNEGFATYFNHLWMGRRDGAEAYLAGIQGSFDAVTAGDKADAPYQRAMVSKDYRDPWEMFGGPAGPYPKGASILHMLRQKLGDEVFFRGLSVYVERYKFQTVETNDLRRVLEEVSGENLERFFQQWCYRPGVPDLDIGVEWDAAAKEVVVSVKQTQNIDGPNPAFVFDLPVWADSSGGALGTVRVREREAVGRFKLGAEPQMVAIDPGLSVLARMTITQPAARWITQLQRGPTVAARVQAARALKSDQTLAATAALARLARDPKVTAAARTEAIRSLAHRKNADSLIEVSTAGLEPAEVGVAMAAAAGDLGNDVNLESNQRARFRSYLLGRAVEDPSVRVRAAALRAMGKLKAVESLNIMLSAVTKVSQDDRLRQSALEALADLDAAEGLGEAIRCSAPGIFNRTRPTAIRAIERLAHHDPAAAYAALIPLLDDRESRAWRAAGSALVALGDPRAIPELERAAAAKRNPDDARALREWAATLAKKDAPAAPKSP